MKTLADIKNMMEELKELYDDVQLFQVEDTKKIHEGQKCAVRVCPAARRGNRFCRQCIVKQALEEEKDKTKVEFFKTDIVLMNAKYIAAEGKNYVLETVQVVPESAIVEPEDGEPLLAQLVGYNAKLYHDALTGMYNRRYYEDVVRNMEGPSGVVVMDLDDFKVHNDTYGHHGGDVALEMVAEVVRRNIRKSDALIRFGGDEFLLIMEDINEEQMKTRLENIREQVRSAVIPGCPHMRVTISIGGVMQKMHEPMDEAVRRADKMMYQAKNHKNMVSIAGENDSVVSSPIDQEQKTQILIVDDSQMNREILSGILNEDFQILEAENGEQCLNMLHQYGTSIALVLLDLVMPVMDGFEVLSYMNRDHTIEDIPVIMISSEDSEASIRHAYEMGVSDYVSRPFDAKVVNRRVYNTIKLYSKQRRLISMVTEQIREREKNVSMMVAILSQIVEFRNGESGLHVQHIRMLTEYILDKLMEKDTRYKISEKEQEIIPLASAIHDIGKIAIDDKILNKPGRLTPEEFNIMKMHTVYGAKMLEGLKPYYDEPLLQTSIEIARWHHERWDGGGYPDGLRGDEIPISAQIVSIADVYDALTSERCYKKAYDHETAMKMILGGECGVFNPVLIECLVEIQDELKSKIYEDPSIHG